MVGALAKGVLSSVLTCARKVARGHEGSPRLHRAAEQSCTSIYRTKQEADSLGTLTKTLYSF
eukprot:3482179-Amphidinium_carterae.1